VKSVLRSEIHTAMWPIVEKTWCNPHNLKYITSQVRNDAGGGPNHGYRQHVQNVVKIARLVPEICSRTDRQTDTHAQTHTRTYSSQYFATAFADEVTRNAWQSPACPPYAIAPVNVISPNFYQT